MSKEKSNTSLVKKVFIFSLFSAFLVMGILSMKRAMPEPKEERIYKAIKIYSPYQLEKRIGGLTILKKREGTKEKISAAEVLLRLDELDKAWGHNNLSVVDNDVIVKKDDNTTVKIPIKTEKERAFLKRFFGI